MFVATRFLFLCAAVLALPTTTTAQTAPPHLDPGWYSNGTSALICEDCAGSTLRITWQNSYVYKYPGTDPLYWYAQIMYLNTGSKTLNITCDKHPDPSAVKELMRETPNAGYVTADETFCTRNPGRIVSLKPGEALDDWAIFHNVPWKGGQVSLEDDYYGPSAWVDPWASPYPVGEIPPPAECPPELVTLGTCVPVSVWNENTKAPATPPTSNLIVLVHGCCTNATDFKDKWLWRGRLIAQTIQPTSTWEIAVWDWTKYTPPPIDFITAYNHAAAQGGKLKDIIALRPYEHLHLIAHSAGSKLIHTVQQALLAKYLNSSYNKPFIHMTFLDAYTPNNDNLSYGFLADYAEHYVDRAGPPFTDTDLTNAYNFDITAWKDLSVPTGHHRPPIWYERSIEFPGYGGIYGYALSLEGGEKAVPVSNLSTRFPPGAHSSCELSDALTATCGTQ